jgi:hypothetical protein
MRLYLAILIAAASTAHADVIFEEPTRITCGRSEVIVAGTIDGTTAAGPFTNAQPPTVKVTATACWKGCKPGDRLEVAQWVDPQPSHSGKPPPSDSKAERAAWEKAAVQPPAKGTKVMLFLRHDGTQLVRLQDSGGYGGYVMLVGADDKQIQRSAGMCEVAITIAGDRDRTAVAGKPVLVHVDVTNTSGTTAVFHAEAMTLKLQTDTRPGEDLSPAWTPLPAITLKPDTQLAFDWDLAKLFPGVFVKPGSYWLTLDAPGAMGRHWISIAVK